MGLGEGTLILSDIRRLGPFLGVQILNFWGEGGSERVISKGPRTVSYSICPNFDSLWLG